MRCMFKTPPPNLYNSTEKRPKTASVKKKNKNYIKNNLEIHYMKVQFWYILRCIIYNKFNKYKIEDVQETSATIPRAPKINQYRGNYIHHNT